MRDLAISSGESHESLTISIIIAPGSGTALCLMINFNVTEAIKIKFKLIKSGVTTRLV